LNISGGVLLLSEQCRVKLTVGRVKSQGGVVGIEDVISQTKTLHSHGIGRAYA